MTMPRTKQCPKTPLIFPEHKVAVTPMQSGYRLGSMMEFCGYDACVDPQRLQILRRGAEHYLQEPYCEPVVEKWCGWRPMTYDSVPIIDRSPALRNVLVAAGHNMLGLSMGTGTGKLVSEILSGSEPHVDADMYSLARFKS
jgi:D-amino-acid dehydrogenase